MYMDVYYLCKSTDDEAKDFLNEMVNSDEKNEFDNSIGFSSLPSLPYFPFFSLPSHFLLTDTHKLLTPSPLLIFRRNFRPQRQQHLRGVHCILY